MRNTDLNNDLWDDDADNLDMSMSDTLEDHYAHKYGLPKIAEQHGGKFLASVARHAASSPVLTLFARLAGLDGFSPLSFSWSKAFSA